MFNPFALLTNPLLLGFIKAGKTYFVRQTFNRGKNHSDEGIKGYFIFTHYSEAGHAEHHLGAISQDPHRFMYHWHIPEHQQKLIAASQQPPGYRIYSGVFEKDWQKNITDPMKEKLRKYIHRNLGWNPAAAETVGFEIYCNYGELYARLKLGSQEVRVKLEDIENFR